jgi:hypothetical protein
VGGTTQRTRYAVHIQTATPRRWVAFPNGLTIGGQFFAYHDVEVSSITESPDGTSVLACTLIIENLQNVATDLVFNSANIGAPVTITKVTFDDATFTSFTTESYLEGRCGLPRVEGPAVVIECRADLGRRGESPSTKWSVAMVNHVPPGKNTKIPWLNVQRTN